MENVIAMNKKMIKESHILRNYTEGYLSRKAAAGALGLSERQITRKARMMKENGEASLIHGNTGRKPSRTVSEETKQSIVRLKQNPIYMKANINHFREILWIRSERTRPKWHTLTSKKQSREVDQKHEHVQRYEDQKVYHSF
jgi:hypothetical protein